MKSRVMGEQSVVNAEAIHNRCRTLKRPTEEGAGRMNSLREQLRQMLGDRAGQRNERGYYTSLDYILLNGQSFTTIGLPPRYASHAGKMKACFRNAFDLASAFPDALRYAEGLTGGRTGSCLFASMHAWCVDLDGRAIDPTWGPLPDYRTGTEYLGVVFPLDYVAEILRRHRVFDSVIENWRDGCPLLCNTAVRVGMPILELHEDPPPSEG